MRRISDDAIAPEVIEAAHRAFWDAYDAPGDSVPPDVENAAMRAAIRAADEVRGLKALRIPCGCDKGMVEDGPAGATYSSFHERCKGAGELIRLVGPERPYWFSSLR